MNRGDVAVWTALLLVGLAFEYRELREGPTGVPLSRVLRAAFRTHHPLGRVAFCAAVGLGAGVLARHICTIPPALKEVPCPTPRPPRLTLIEPR